jgi:hypothetical protein
MRRYNGFSNATNTASATAPLAAVNANGATTRARIYDFVIGSDATPADAATKIALQRMTTSGLGTTTVVPPPLDAADPASLMTWISAWSSTQPTITAVTTLLQVGMNQRATFRWVAVPDSELVVPATTNNGIAVMSVVASATANYAFSAQWQE